MEALAIATRAILAATFLAAGAAKLLDRSGFKATLQAFGVRGTAVRAAAVVVPVIEIAVAFALLNGHTAFAGSLFAGVLLVAFTLVVAVELGRGRRIECRCFGQLGVSTIGARTLLRNVLVLAVTAVLAGSASRATHVGLVEQLSRLSTIDGVLVAGLALLALGSISQAIFFGQLLRQHGRLLARLTVLEQRADVAPPRVAPIRRDAGLPVGMPAPGFALTDESGSPVTLEGLLAIRDPVLVLFADPDCGPCRSLISELSTRIPEANDALTLSVISTGPMPGIDGVPILLEADFATARSYRVPGTPAAVLIETDGTIAAPLAMGGEEIQHLLDRFPDNRRAVDHSGDGRRKEVIRVVTVA